MECMAQVRQFLPGEDQSGMAYSPSVFLDPVSLEADMSIIAVNNEIQFPRQRAGHFRFPTSSLAPTSVGSEHSRHFQLTRYQNQFWWHSSSLGLMQLSSDQSQIDTYETRMNP